MEIALLLSLFGMSVASGLVPVVNAEVLVVGAAVAAPSGYLIPVVAVSTLGQMVAKVALYACARWIPERLPARARARLDRAADKAGRLKQSGYALVLVSAIVGLPPFYAITLAAGAMKMKLAGFVVAGTLGRVVRFAALAYGTVAVESVV